VVRGTAQNPDTFFQAREASNAYYDACPGHVIRAFEDLAKRTGRSYRLFEYSGHPRAERVVVVMGSAAHTVRKAVEHLQAKGEAVGLLEVRLYRPFSIAHFVEALPRSVRKIGVLDRTKEPGAVGEPLYLDVASALSEHWSGDRPRVVGGRYGLSSKEFTPEMALRVFEELDSDNPKRHFTVGIVDDVTHLSLERATPGEIEPDAHFEEETYQAVFYGLGSDGTVGANKNSLKIIATETDYEVQGYFVYDS
jgi:pyruvate-ferredoxin/flavodoxin oxidoreductase